MKTNKSNLQSKKSHSDVEHTWVWVGLNTAGCTPCALIIVVCCCGMPDVPPGQGGMGPMGLPLF
jgi:hypothetical protein